ncbi:alpha/beta-hydrolase [Aspergillus avenaceus]|uniref:Alpha/beta-hydrolase n=1 Tax=Aspergillus avenaceus TaxID=36643 RepID=A0A5N6U2D1_ASPAV|nr:alpha/beta-hydrolase [Aspergillus avenaceus]
MSPKPTILLLHGAWNKPANYKPYITALETAGFEVHCPHLPTCRDTLKTFSDDVACVREVLDSLVQAGKKVMVIMHSYGGCVGSDALQEYSFPESNPNSSGGGVVHLLYMCAYMLRPGVSAWDLVERTGLDAVWPQYFDDWADGTSFPRYPDLWFYGGMEKETVDALIPRLARFPLQAIREKIRGDPWRRLPVTYARTEKDYALPKSFQDIMLDEAVEDGVKLRVEVYDTSHSVFLIQTEEMVRLAVEAAADERNPI